MRIEQHNLDGRGHRDHEVYDMVPMTKPVFGPGSDDPIGECPDYWAAVTSVPCPVEGCDQVVVWYEAGYVPGYRVCMSIRDNSYDRDSLRHRFLAGGDGTAPTLIRVDDAGEEEI